MTTVRPDGGDLLVDVVQSLGVDCAFGVVSVHNLPLVGALERRLRFVPVRHEAAAVNAADGYARASGRLGVAVTSTGTGSGNAAGSLVESLSAGSAVLHLTGQIPFEHLGSNKGVIHETRDQLGMLAAVSKAAYTLRPDDVAGRVLRTAAHEASTAPCGPVSVEWPIDLQYLPQTDAGAEARGTCRELDGETLERVAGMLTRSRRPLLWLGGGARGARAEVADLVQRLGAGVLTSNAGRGVVREDDPRCIGNFAANPACAELLAEADLLLSVGTHFRSNETRDYALALPRPHVQIDIDPDALGRAYPCDERLSGDASEVLRALLDLIPPGAGEEAWSRRVTATRRAARDHLREGIGPQGEVCDAMRESLPEEAVIARDVTIPSSAWGNRLLEIYDPATNVFPRGGGIGQGLAMGIGAALADPSRPVAVMVGDGGLAVHLGELLTLAQEEPWLVVVLFNDGGYGVLRNMQDRYVGRRAGVDLTTPDFARLCASMCLPHSLITAASQMEAAMTEAIARRGPAVIEVDVEAIGEMPRPFIPPVPVPEP